MPRLDTRAMQARLLARGFDCGAVDGVMGGRTRTALAKAGGVEGLGIHPSGLHSIVLHWTGGGYSTIQLELDHYHVLVNNQGRAIPGKLKPEANSDISDGVYCAHTRGANTGRIGVAVDAMANADERPFWKGTAPITPRQFAGFCEAVADLCQTYAIPVSRWTVLSHAEVERNLGIPQRGKWDITWLPGMDEPGDPVVVGNRIRAEVSHILRARGAAARPGTVPPTALPPTPGDYEILPRAPAAPKPGFLEGLLAAFPCMRRRG